jgi:hypothetical protein
LSCSLFAPIDHSLPENLPTLRAYYHLSPRIYKNGALQTAKDGGFSDHQWLYCSTFGANANPMPVKTCSLSHHLPGMLIYGRDSLSKCDRADRWNWAKHCASLGQMEQNQEMRMRESENG